MFVIDADSHIDENEETWSYLADSERRFQPTTFLRQDPRGREDDRWWQFFDNVVRERRMRDDARTGTTLATRELLDVDARLRHMDELGVDVHVIYPTAFLTALTARADTDVALCRSYNRWLAEKCSQSNGRLRWVATMPALDMATAVEEVAWAKEHGAVGMMKRGIEFGRPAGDPYFYPLYEAASQHDIAVCVHAASGDPALNHLIGAGFGGLWPQTLPVVAACSSMLHAGLPQRFPRLRTGFIEAGSSWVPYVLDDYWARAERQAARDMAARAALQPERKRGLFKECRFYVAYQTHEDLAYLLEHGLEDCLVIGTDYSHPDQSADLAMLRTMQERATKGELSETVVRKMLDDNPRALYGI